MVSIIAPVVTDLTKKQIRHTYFFEIYMQLHFCILPEKIDIGVIEVGMVGRLDATNVINPVVSILQ